MAVQQVSNFATSQLGRRNMRKDGAARSLIEIVKKYYLRIL